MQELFPSGSARCLPSPALGTLARFSLDFGCLALDLVGQEAAGVGQGEVFHLTLGTLQDKNAEEQDNLP